MTSSRTSMATEDATRSIDQKNSNRLFGRPRATTTDVMQPSSFTLLSSRCSHNSLSPMYTLQRFAFPYLEHSHLLSNGQLVLVSASSVQSCFRRTYIFNTLVSGTYLLNQMTLEPCHVENQRGPASETCCKCTFSVRDAALPAEYICSLLLLRILSLDFPSRDF